MKSSSPKTLEWEDDHLVRLDQRHLPQEGIYPECRYFDAVVEAIRDMAVRGTPPIGVAAAFGLAMGVMHIQTGDRDAFVDRFKELCHRMGKGRPTAVNPFWAIQQMEQILHSPQSERVDEVIPYRYVDGIITEGPSKEPLGPWRDGRREPYHYPAH